LIILLILTFKKPTPSNPTPKDNGTGINLKSHPN
jgi:hypothetical protein